MRKGLPEKPEADQPTEGKEDLKGKAASTRSKNKKKGRKKALKESKAEAGLQGAGKSAAGPISNQGKQAAPDLLSNPEAKGRGLVTGNREEEESATRLETTPRGECSGQKMPDS
jgi:hypothetical protein